MTGPDASRAVLRLFIALWLPESLRKEALARLDALRPGSRGVRWVRPDQLHLTLKFLGGTPESRLQAVDKALAGVAASAAPIGMSLAKGGTFPPSGPPRVIWLGVEPERELARLAAEVEKALEPAGFPRESRAFRPHLTLGRAEPGASFGLDILGNQARAGSELVSELSLVQSVLRAGGAVYTTLRSWKLGRAPGAGIAEQ